MNSRSGPGPGAKLTPENPARGDLARGGRTPDDTGGADPSAWAEHLLPQPQAAPLQRRRRSLRVGAELSVSCQELDASGCGIASSTDVRRADDASPTAPVQRTGPVESAERVTPSPRIHVPGLLPGERAYVKVVHVSPHVGTSEKPESALLHRAAFATLLRRDNAAPERQIPACGAFGQCGGCTLQHLSYAAQLQFKRALLHDQLAAVLTPRADTGPALPAASPALAGSVEVAPCVPSPQPLHYRSRVKLVAARAPSESGASGLPRIILGAYAPRSHLVIDLAGCKVNEPVLQQVAGTLSRKWSEAGLSVYDEDSGRGALRYVLLRKVHSGAVQVSLVVAESPPRPPLLSVVAALAAAHPQLASVVLHHNPHSGNALLATTAPSGHRASGARSEAGDADAELGTNDDALLGPDFLYEDLGVAATLGSTGLRVRVSARSFLQVNRAVASRIYADVAAALPAAAGETILDLYCGVGALGRTVLAASPQARLIGIESSPSAVADAEHSARLAGLTDERARFLCGAVEALLPGLFKDRAARPPLLVLLNPPRRGCTPAVLSELLSCAPRAIAYVSCSPQSLARDLRVLIAAGYKLRQVTPYDMHPGTPHVETVALLARVDPT